MHFSVSSPFVSVLRSSFFLVQRQTIRPHLGPSFGLPRPRRFSSHPDPRRHRFISEHFLQLNVFFALTCLSRFKHYRSLLRNVWSSEFGDNIKSSRLISVQWDILSLFRCPGNGTFLKGLDFIEQGAYLPHPLVLYARNGTCKSSNSPHSLWVYFYLLGS